MSLVENIRPALVTLNRCNLGPSQDIEAAMAYAMSSASKSSLLAHPPRGLKNQSRHQQLRVNLKFAFSGHPKLDAEATR
jgi:hypothetical protein